MKIVSCGRGRRRAALAPACAGMPTRCPRSRGRLAPPGAQGPPHDRLADELVSDVDTDQNEPLSFPP